MAVAKAEATVASPEEVIERTRQLIPALRERIAETESLRKLPDATIQDAADAGIFSLLMPAALGGSGADLRHYAEVIRLLGQGDPTAAWTLGFLCSHNWFLARYPKEAQDDAFAQGAPGLMAGVANPPGKAEEVEGGYLVTGYWGYCSAVMHCAWVQVTATVEGRDRPSLFLLPVEDVDVQDTWYMAGMQGTGSHDVKLDRQFVPTHREVNIDLWHSRRNHGGELYPEPLYRYDARDVLVFLIPSILIGAAEGMLEMYRDRVEKRRAAFSPTIVGDTVLGQTRYARAVAPLRSAKALMASSIEETIEENAKSSDELSHEFRALMKLDCLNICEDVRRSLDTVVRGSGSSQFKSSDIAQHFLRDSETMLSHLTIDEDGMYSQAGSILLDRPDGPDPARNFT